MTAAELFRTMYDPPLWRKDQAYRQGDYVIFPDNDRHMRAIRDIDPNNPKPGTAWVEAKHYYEYVRS